MTQDIVSALFINAAVFSVLFLLMLPLRALLKNRASALLQYALWAVVVVKLLLPFGFESNLSPLRFFNEADMPDAAAATDAADTQAALAALSDESIHPLDDTDAQAAQQTTAQPTYPRVSGQEETAVSAPQVAASVIPPLAWTDWALIGWALGALIVGGVQALCAVNLRRRACRARLALPERIARIADGCTRELGIKQRVRVVLQSALKTPAAMGAFRPLLALPEDAQTQTDAQIRHICLHELTHIKHGDIAVIALMGALRAVYWLNPLVWLCFGLVRRDMEAACDSRVLRHIGTDARQEYIGTVLHFAERKDERQLYAAMGMADGRMPMEQRIRSMFRQTRTGRAAKAVALCLAALMLAMSALTACQPTPETPVVVGKDQDAMLSAAAQTPSALQATLAEQVAAPEAYSANVSAADGKLTVTANGTPLIIPDVGSMPIVRVTAADFTQRRWTRCWARSSTDKHFMR
jgi:bla regulator protein BlaR1